MSLVNELLRPKYSDVIFYCHNLGGYDIVFILKALYIYNAENPNDKYEISCILRDDKIIKVKISKNKNSFTILDSYTMLPDKLSKLGANFDVATIKSNFPYKFAVQDHLFYEGVIPSIDCYEDISEQEYKDMFIGYWSFQDETFKYLKNDLYSLYEVLIKANKQVFLDYNANMTSYYYIKFSRPYIFKEFINKNIPMINKPSIYTHNKSYYLRY